jgi:dihydrofolate reductase/predicted transcriptional regulator YdeE
MRKLIVSEFVSLDGVMQAPGGVNEDREGGFERGGWTWPYWHDDIGGAFFEAVANADTLLLGRKTYVIHGRAFEPMPEGDPFGDVMKALKKVVVTQTLTDLFWRNSTAIRGDLVESVRALKAQDGKDILTDGSHQLVHALLAADLVDELQLIVYPVLLGGGKRVLPEGVHLPFALASSKALPSGVILNRYTRAGARPNFAPPRVETRPAMRMVGIERRVRGGDAAIPQLWDEFVPRMMSELPRSPHSYGVMTDRQDDGMMNYMAGVPVAADTPVPAGMSVREVPASHYAVLDTRLPELGEAFGHLYGVCIPALETAPVDGPTLEEYGMNYSPANPVLRILAPVKG